MTDSSPPPQPPIRRRRGLKIALDFSQPRPRRYAIVGLLFLFLVTSGFIFGGYKVYEYTESAEFCGTVCHPMFPQFERYEASEHVNVSCAECHIGPGADFFVKSKIDGIRQVYATITHTYSQPIKSPVENLRPARETCETCHTPTAYQDNIVKTINRYDNDYANTPIQSTLILKTGGWKEDTGIAHGIHWHVTNQVYYIAADEQRQVMSWVGVVYPDGTQKEFYSRDMLTLASTSFVERARRSGEMRLLDCIDCHNRAAHLIPSPDMSIDQAITNGLISQDLPFIRAKAIEVLNVEYQSSNDAYQAISDLRAFYREGYPKIYQQYETEVTAALEVLRTIYDRTHFPEMHLDWKTNPDNESHSPNLGCFRCHDGKHVSLDKSGNEAEVISVKCNLCHTVPIIGRGDDLLVEAPVIVGPVPETHADFRWTISHRDIGEAGKQECYICHGQGFCNNGACHNLEHPEDMLYKHAEIYRNINDIQTCYACHQNITCTRCHPGGAVINP